MLRRALAAPAIILQTTTPSTALITMLRSSASSAAPTLAASARAAAPLPTPLLLRGAARGLPRAAARFLSSSRTKTTTAASATVAASQTSSGGTSSYRRPPQEILKIVDAPPQPSLTYSPDRRTLLQASRPPPLPPLSEVAREELKLAGLRLDQEQRSRSRMGFYTGLELVPSTASVPAAPGSTDGAVRVTGIPKGALINMVTWSPDGRRVAFTVRSPGGSGGEGELAAGSDNDPTTPSYRRPRHPLQLWVADARTGVARPLLGTAEPVEPSAVEEAEAAGATAASSASSPPPLCPYPTPGLNTVFDSYSWVDGDTIVACVIPPGQGPCPRRPPLPPGPKVLDNTSGGRQQSRTFADLLSDEHDASVLEHVSTSELVEVCVETGKWAPLAPGGGGEGAESGSESDSGNGNNVEGPSAPLLARHPPPRMYTEVDPSPDGRYVLVSWIERPFSFTVPCGRFPARVELWRRGLRGQRAAEADSAALAAAAAAGAEARREATAKQLPPDAVEEAVLAARAEAEAQARGWKTTKSGGAAAAPLLPPSASSFIREVAFLPLAENIPIAFNAVRQGPRAIGWRDDKPCEVAWIECRDGGDPDVAESPRDVVFSLGADEAAAATAAGAASAPPQPRLVAQTDLRCGGVAWGDEEFALLYESWWKTRTSRVWVIAPEDGAGEKSGNGGNTNKKQLLFDRNYEDAYGDPGSPLSRRTALGTYVLAKVDGKRRLLMTGGGAAPSGARPFLDLLDLEPANDPSKWRRVRLWRSQPPYLESCGSVMSDGDPEQPLRLDGLRVLLSRETQRDPPQSWLRTFLLSGGGDDAARKMDALLALAVPATEEDGAAPVSASSSSSSSSSSSESDDALAAPSLPLFTLPPSAVAADPPTTPSPSSPLLSWRERQVTFYPHPHPTLRDVRKEVVRYKRKLDGLELTATLYLPPGYDQQRDGPLPCLLWAYPREFVSKEAAGQNRRSPYAFAGVGLQSPTLWLARGYAVLDGPAFPIVPANPGDEPNDTFVPQLVANAQAAVAEVVRRGVADPRRIAIGGTSYGAHMTASLMAHAPKGLFAAAIARSGAYNRTLTPFSFQSEERTFWQVPEVYAQMSPFHHADKVKTPILLIHGADDPNPGTKVLQSERFYDALKGHGATARLVILPFERHSYSARESVLHALAEQDAWLERYSGFGRVEEEEESDEGGGASSS